MQLELLEQLIDKKEIELSILKHKYEVLKERIQIELIEHIKGNIYAR